MNTENELKSEYVRSLLDYDPETGILRWKTSVGGPQGARIQAGSIAGSKSTREGYLVIGIDGKTYRAHRLAWLIFTG